MTSRSDFGRAMTGTNLKANCAYFEGKKKWFLDFFSTFKVSKRFL